MGCSAVLTGVYMLHHFDVDSTLPTRSEGVWVLVVHQIKGFVSWVDTRVSEVIFVSNNAMDELQG